jgi:hypothetical protein
VNVGGRRNRGLAVRPATTSAGRHSGGRSGPADAASTPAGDVPGAVFAPDVSNVSRGGGRRCPASLKFPELLAVEPERVEAPRLQFHGENGGSAIWLPCRLRVTPSTSLPRTSCQSFGLAERDRDLRQGRVHTPAGHRHRVTDGWRRFQRRRGSVAAPAMREQGFPRRRTGRRASWKAGVCV